MFWAMEAQRQFQDSMAQALGAIRSGDMSVIWALCGATAAYGFVHALGPGHGKVLLGGAAMATGSTLKRMTMLTIISSLAQAGTAILFVGGLAVVFGLSAQRLGPIADNWLAPASYTAIAALGAYLVWRSLQHWRRISFSRNHDHAHDHHGQCCSHSHGPSLSDVEALGGLRDAVFLIVSIAIRPCTGAIFVLIIALRFDVFWVGCLAVVSMGLGTAAFNLIVAASGVSAKRLSMLNVKGDYGVARISAIVQLLGGSMIFLFSVLWLIRF
ncbi:MAG: hypothetical protein AAF871_01845 [Pseudomonadota bacterium]